MVITDFFVIIIIKNKKKKLQVALHSRYIIKKEISWNLSLLCYQNIEYVT